MGLELANEKWLSGDEAGLLGQFASTKGYSDLIKAASAKNYPALAALFERGATEDVAQAQRELTNLAAKAPKDVASTARDLERLMRGQEFVMITNGVS